MLTPLVPQMQNCHQLPNWQLRSYRMASALETMRSTSGKEKKKKNSRHLENRLGVHTGGGHVGGGAWSKPQDVWLSGKAKLHCPSLIGWKTTGPIKGEVETEVEKGWLCLSTHAGKEGAEKEPRGEPSRDQNWTHSQG